MTAQLGSDKVELSATELEYLEDNIATVAFHLGRPGARLSVAHEGRSAGLIVEPGEVLAEVSRRLAASPVASAAPLDEKLAFALCEEICDLIESGINETRELAAKVVTSERVRLALYRSVEATGKPDVAAEDWKDDPSSDERWNAGVDFVMMRLCGFMGVDPHMVSWDAATETVDGDISAVIGNILRAKLGEDWGPDSTPPINRDPLASEAPSPVASAERVALPPTQEYVLRAMANNYGAGPHCWDHLDREACAKAADEIKTLRAALSRVEATEAALPDAGRRGS